MKRLTIRAAAAAAFLSSAISLSAPVMASSVTGTVKSYDRVAKVLVMVDKSEFPLDNVKAEIPPTLSVGDRVTVDFEGDEGGVSAINSITILSEGDQG